MRYRRYGIYYCFPPGPLAAAGAAWLGWDIDRGAPAAPPPGADWPAARAGWVARPSRYGFHATMKPPFTPLPGSEDAALRRAFAALCRAAAPVEVPGLALARMGRFLALEAEGDAAPLRALHARALAALEPFRAPPGEAELARRAQGRLSARQSANLLRWGYPHVMEDFRFHVTLTGPLPPEDRAPARAVLERDLVPLLPRPFRLEALSLVGEDEDGRFHLVQRLPLTG